MSGKAVSLLHVTKRDAEGHLLLDDVSFDVEPGGHVALVGQVGSGKTLVLRLIAGAEQLDEGAVIVDGVSVAALGYRELQAHRASTGFAFELAGLLANQTIFENVALPLRYHEGGRLGEEEIRARVSGLLEELHVAPATAALLPARVNASVRKRALLCRALVLEPRLLLFDEPQAALVTAEQRLVQEACDSRRKSRGMTIIQADHDGHFGPFVPDRVVFLERGRVKGIGAPGTLTA